MVRGRRPKTILTGLFALALLAPAGAQAAATKPGVSTGSATRIGQQAATLTGAVNPHGGQTTYAFQYGTTRAYGVTTASIPAGNGTRALVVTAQIAALAPATVYHYRLVARNLRGTVRGRDRTFRTRRQPLGVSLAGAPNPTPINKPVTLFGQLTGTGNANRQVVLQSRPFPYTAPFLDVAGVNRVVTDSGGNFRFLLASVALNTQYVVRMPAKPSVVSPIVSVGVKPYVTTHAPRTAKRRGRTARLGFKGTITPTRDGAQVIIQKRVHGRWTAISATTARHRSALSSKYAKHIRQRHGGDYRILVNPLDGAYVGNVGKTVHIRLKRR